MNVPCNCKLAGITLYSNRQKVSYMQMSRRTSREQVAYPEKVGAEQVKLPPIRKKKVPNQEKSVSTQINSALSQKKYCSQAIKSWRFAAYQKSMRT